MKTTWKMMAEYFAKFKKQNNLPDAYELKSGDARCGSVCAIVKRTERGSISVVYGYNSYKEVIAWMDGYSTKNTILSSDKKVFVNGDYTIARLYEIIQSNVTS